MEQTGTSSLTTLQATLIIGLRLDVCGLDNIGWTHVRQAIAMAHDLQLFKQSTCIKGNRMRQSRDFTAWCLFNWQRQAQSRGRKITMVANTRLSLRCYYFLVTPLIKEPPRARLPDPEQNPAWYGELWIKYPLVQTLFPMHYGYLFKARSELSVIINRIALELFDKEGGKAAQSSRKIAAGFVRDLKAWHFSLPDPLTPKEVVFPSQFKLG